MATRLRINMEGDKVGPKLRDQSRRRTEAVRKAIRETAAEVAKRIEDEGRADISSAGNFGPRWTDGFTATVTRGGGSTVITTRMAVPYWRVFQFGNVTQGKPLLWIPLSFASDALGVRARDYPGQLFRVDRKNGGAPLLLAPGAKGTKAQPKYFGKDHVTIPKKFHLLEIIRDIAREMGDTFRKNRG
jgi:hypothetical protein